MILKASYPLLKPDGWDVFYVTNEGSCKYESTKKMVLWNFWGVICSDFIILWIDSYVYLSRNS